MIPAKRTLLSATGLIGFLLIWETIARSGFIEAHLLPPPSTLAGHAGFGDLARYLAANGLGKSPALFNRLRSGLVLRCVLGSSGCVVSESGGQSGVACPGFPPDPATRLDPVRDHLVWHQ